LRRGAAVSDESVDRAALTRVQAAIEREVPLVSCVIPAFNEAVNLPALLNELMTVLPTLSPRFEVVVVDDGSQDNTAAVVSEWTLHWPLRLLCLSRNFGKEAALRAGLDHAHGDAVILMDADGQHPPALLPALFERWLAGFDNVVAMREHRGADSGWRRVSTRVFYALLGRIASVPIEDGAGDFRLMSRTVVQALRQMPEQPRFMKGQYGWVGFSVARVPYTPRRRNGGQTTFAWRSLLSLARVGVLCFSDVPLRVWTGIGACVSLASVSYGAFLLMRTLIWGHEIPGWTTVVVSVLVLGGLQLLSIGLLGEYLAEVFREVKRRPAYVVARDIGRQPTAV